MLKKLLKKGKYRIRNHIWNLESNFDSKHKSKFPNRFFKRFNLTFINLELDFILSQANYWHGSRLLFVALEPLFYYPQEKQSIKH